MFSYIIRRLLLMIPTLFGVTVLVFFVLALSPGGIGGQALDQQGNVQGEQAKRVREYYNKRYGIDKPVIVQYARWLNQLSPLGWKQAETGEFTGFGFKWPSLGESLTRHRPVADLLRESVPVTILLNLMTIPLVYGIAIMTGIFAAKHRGGLFDVSTSATFLGLWSVPTIWAGVLLIGFLANEQYLNWFPTHGLHGDADMLFLPSWPGGEFQPGWLLDTAWHLVLPVICLAYGSFAFLSKLTRSSILENLTADYVRTARAKGVRENVVLYRHVFRNSLLALITVAAGIIPGLLGGSIVIEQIFSIPGMGRLGVEAVMYRDRELLLAITLIGGVIGLSSQLLRDVLYAIADPRVSYE